jgi:hypothetical protein
MGSAWSFIESFAVQLVLTILKLVVKSPASVKTEASVIKQLAQLATEADTAVNGTAWTSVAGTPPVL